MMPFHDVISLGSLNYDDFIIHIAPIKVSTLHVVRIPLNVAL